MTTSVEDWGEEIAIDSAIQGGRPVIKGTRVLVQVIVGSLAGGMTVQEVCEQYRVTEQQVSVALAYASDVVANEAVLVPH